MRFLNCLLYDLNFTRKEKFIFSLVIFVGVITLAICLQIGGYVSGFIFGITCPLLVLFFAIGTLYMASHFGMPFRKKQTSIQYLMLPASASEKFWARFINQCVIPPVLGILSVVAALGLLYLVHLVVDLRLFTGLQDLAIGFESAFYGVSPEMVTRYNSLLNAFLILMVVSIILQFSEMVLGSLVFGKYAFIKTLIVSTVLGWVITPFLYNQKAMVFQVQKIDNSDPTAVLDVLEQVLSMETIGFYAVCIVVLIVISYILFKKKTITKTGL